MLANLSDVKIAPADVEQYILMRRQHINPVLAQQPGFRGSTLLRPHVQPSPDLVTFALFNHWADEAAAAAWAVAPRHDEVSQYVIPLVRSISSHRYELMGAASVTSADESVARVARISFQKVKAGRIEEYLDYRRTVIHPSMEKADGFVAAWVLRDTKDPARFAIYLRWASAEAGEAYFQLPHHLGAITDRVKELIESPLATTRYDIVPVDPR
jgi:heme-degrading monooxygenase HmoA